jgi:adenine-specific DNA-methyltransferase
LIQILKIERGALKFNWGARLRFFCDLSTVQWLTVFQTSRDFKHDTTTSTTLSIQTNNVKKLVMPTLNWIGKSAVEKHHKDVPYRLLELVPELSCGDTKSGNLIVQGDNLHALKALLPRYAGQVKCIYIDPPYNTGNEGWAYNDNVNSPEIRKWLGAVVGKEGETLDRHDRWLCMMYPRLVLLKQLLRNDGVIFISIDDNELNYLKAVMDEVFGASSYINTIAVKTKNSSGASGGGEDRRLKKNIEFILAYGGKDFFSFNEYYTEIELSEYLEMMELEGKSFKYTSVLYSIGEREFYKTIKDGFGNDMVLYKIKQYETRSISSIAKEEGISVVDVIYKYYDKVHTTENAQTSIRTRVYDATDKGDSMFALEYYPISGRSKGKLTELLFVGQQKRLISWFKNVTLRKGKKIVKREKLGTFWEDVNWNNVTREGGVRFPNGQKPEKFISICLELVTKPGDLVLDSFLGSGTTAAVAHKMGRKWIGIELGEHCDTHCVPRLQSVVSGEDKKGISELYSWQGGGGFEYYRLSAEPLFTADGQVRTDVTFAQLAEFVWLKETGTGFTGNADTPLLGIHQGRAVYLLYNGILKDKTSAGGNVLTPVIFNILPEFNGGKIIYAAAVKGGSSWLGREQITFKQTPYALEL